MPPISGEIKLHANVVGNFVGRFPENNSALIGVGKINDPCKWRRRFDRFVLAEGGSDGNLSFARKGRNIFSNWRHDSWRSCGMEISYQNRWVFSHIESKQYGRINKSPNGIDEGNHPSILLRPCKGAIYPGAVHTAWRCGRFQWGHYQLAKG